MWARSLRRSYSMASQTATSPFSRAVVNAMRRLYPEELADRSFDNTGLLLEAPFDPIRRQMNSALLTIDLTKAVADEAIERNDSIVIAYHPIIFRGLKSLTLGDSQQSTLLRLAAEGISVYSPHSAVDAAAGGLSDWLADIVTGTPADPEELEAEPTKDDKSESASDKDKADAAAMPPPPKPDDASSIDSSKRPTYLLKHHPSQLSIAERALLLNNSNHTRSPIIGTTLSGYDPKTTGQGRIVRFNSPQPLLSIVDRIGLGLGNPKGFPIAIPQGKSLSEMQISSVGICAGSGGHLFRNLDVDLLFTGELSHHEALAAIERGQCVIALFHSNTERGFLHGVLKGQLEEAVKEELAKVREEQKAIDGLGEDYLDALNDDTVEIHVSEMDRDPYGIMINKDEL